MVEHVNIADPNIHEPKGVSTASLGMVYVADGAGSGTWAYEKTGHGYYKDNAAAQVFDTTPAKLSIDGLGSSTVTSRLPKEIRGSDNLWDTTDDKITPIAAGDSYDLRLDLPITAKSGVPTALTVELDIGGGASPTSVIVELDQGLSKTPPYVKSIPMAIFCESTFITNGGQIFLSVDTGTVSVTAPGIFINRTHGEWT